MNGWLRADGPRHRRPDPAQRFPQRRRGRRLRGKLDAPEEEQRRLTAAREAIEQRIDALEAQLTDEQRRATELQRDLTHKMLAAERASGRRAAEAEKAAAARRAAEAETKLATAETRLVTAEKEHEAAYSQLNLRAKNSIAVMERLVGAVGVDPNRAAPPAPPPAVAPPRRRQFQRPASRRGPTAWCVARRRAVHSLA